MNDPLLSEIWEAVSDRIGDDLRVVSRFNPTDYKTKMREDVREQYTSDEDEQIVDDTIITQLQLDKTQQKFNVGDLHGLVRVFDDAFVLSWTDDLPKKSGIIVSIDRDGSAASMDDLDWCIQYLNTEIAPLNT